VHFFEVVAASVAIDAGLVVVGVGVRHGGVLVGGGLFRIWDVEILDDGEICVVDCDWRSRERKACLSFGKFRT